MRAVSIKALLLSNVAFFLAALLIACLAVICGLLAGSMWAGSPDAVDTVVKELSSSFLYLSCVYVFTIVLASLGAGYLAGRVAGHHHAFNGALACGLWAMSSLYELAYGPIFGSDAGPQLPQGVDAALTCASLLCGSLGGMLAGWRDAARAAAGLELSLAAGLRQGAVTVVRWILAFVAAALSYALLLALAGFLASGAVAVGTRVFGLVASITIGVGVVGPGQRRAASFVLMALAVLAPAANWIGHAAAGDPRLMDFFYLFLNLLGVGLCWPSLKRAYPAQFPSKPGPWWWLTSYEYARWSSSERRARLALGFAALTVAVVVAVVGHALLRWAGAGNNLALPIAALACMPPGFLLARPLATWLFADVVREADANAAARLAGYDKVFS
jgi:hypothetical protein